MGIRPQNRRRFRDARKHRSRDSGPRQPLRTKTQQRPAGLRWLLLRPRLRACPRQRRRRSHGTATPSTWALGEAPAFAPRGYSCRIRPETRKARNAGAHRRVLSPRPICGPTRGGRTRPRPLERPLTTVISGSTAVPETAIFSRVIPGLARACGARAAIGEPADEPLRSHSAGAPYRCGWTAARSAGQRRSTVPGGAWSLPHRKPERVAARESREPGLNVVRTTWAQR